MINENNTTCQMCGEPDPGFEHNCISELKRRLVDTKRFRIEFSRFFAYGCESPEDVYKNLIAYRERVADLKAENKLLRAEVEALRGRVRERKSSVVCAHDGYSFKDHGHCCPKCGVFLTDFGD